MESYPFDDVTPEPAAEPAPETGSATPSRVRKIATGAAIGVAVLATGGVAIAATHSGSTTAQGGPGGGPGGGFGGGGFGGPGGSSESGTTGQGGPGGTFGGPGGSGGAPGGTSGTTGSTASGSGAAPAATASPGTSGGSGSGTTGAPPSGGRGFGGGGGIGNALHGTFVVPASSGTGTVTEDLQTGKVTAVSATSIAVTSTDKSVGTFVVTSATKVNQGQSKIADVKVGDTVTVIATDADKKALTIEDRSLAGTSFPGGFGGGRGGGYGGGTPPNGAPTAAPSSAPTSGGETT